MNIPWPHGTMTGYKHHCSCDYCREANRLYHRDQRAKRRLRTKADPSVVPHGLGGYKNWGCHCVECTKANADHSFDQYYGRS